MLLAAIRPNAAIADVAASMASPRRPLSLEGHETARFTLEPGDDAREITLRPLDGTLDSARTVDLAPGQRAGVALVVVVSIVIAVATAGTEAPWGGNTGVVLAPLR